MRTWLACSALAVFISLPAGVSAGEEASSIGLIKAPNFEKAKDQALGALKELKADAGTLQRAETVWNADDQRALLDRVAETLILGDAEAQALIDSARDPNAAAPTAVPDFFKDEKRPAFVRNNVGLYYSKLLVTRRVHEEGLETLKGIRPELTVDPAAYYFYRAVAEHKLQKTPEAMKTIERLLADVPETPERYLTLAMLMKYEMLGWKNQDLAHIARMMDDIARRFDIARGGKLNQEKQKEVIALLDKMIKDLEKQC